MSTLLAYRGTSADPPSGSVIRACFEQAVSSKAMDGSSVFRGHLGVLRQEHFNLERQRRYDFWFRKA